MHLYWWMYTHMGTCSWILIRTHTYTYIPILTTPYLFILFYAYSYGHMFMDTYKFILFWHCVFALGADIEAKGLLITLGAEAALDYLDYVEYKSMSAMVWWVSRRSYVMLVASYTQESSLSPSLDARDVNSVTRYLFDEMIMREICSYLGEKNWKILPWCILRYRITSVKFITLNFNLC